MTLYGKADSLTVADACGPDTFAFAFSVAGYLIMGLVNDSMTVTAPIFWVLLGVGSAWNFIDHA